VSCLWASRAPTASLAGSSRARSSSNAHSNRRIHSVQCQPSARCGRAIAARDEEGLALRIVRRRVTRIVQGGRCEVVAETHPRLLSRYSVESVKILVGRRLDVVSVPLLANLSPGTGSDHDRSPADSFCSRANGGASCVDRLGLPDSQCCSLHSFWRAAPITPRRQRLSE